MLSYFVLGVMLPSFVVLQASHCYRCFGSTWCNNFTDPTFALNVAVIECPTTTVNYFDGNNPFTNVLLNSIKDITGSVNGPASYDGTLMGCVTATVHEAHEDHTVRVCLNQASVICPTIQSVVLSNVNDISSDVRVSCEGCTGDLCNGHTFVEDPPTPPPTDTSVATTAPLPTSADSSTSPDLPSTSESSPITTVVPQTSHCYRCFGSTWCNNFTDPTFASNVDVIECPTTTVNYFDGNNPFTNILLNSIKDIGGSVNGPANYDGTLMGCVTATVHEAHEDHTVRVCLNQASVICPTIQSVVLSNVNDISPDVRVSCEGCTGDLCNGHTFVEVPPTPPPTDTSAATTSPLPTSADSSTSPDLPSTSESSPITTVVPQTSHCYRCFGSTWCNNSTDPTFALNVDVIECPTTTVNYFDGHNPFTNIILNSIKDIAGSVNGPASYDGTLMGCVTATVHEAHEDHTVRLCLNQALLICPTIQSVVLSNVNDISPDVRVSCEGCTGDLCNGHTFVEDPPTPPPTDTSAATTSPLPTSADSSTSPDLPSTSKSSPITTVVPQTSHCYRCFGSTWCNNFTDPTFALNVDVIECPTTTVNYFHENNPFTNIILNSIKDIAGSVNGPANYDGTLMGCVTATVHEAHEDHTVRVCLNQASVICPTIQSVVLSNVNDISPDVRVSCEGCTGDLCNGHTFVEDPPTPLPTDTSAATTAPLPTSADSSTSPDLPSTSESSPITTESAPSSNQPSPTTSESSLATSESLPSDESTTNESPLTTSESNSDEPFTTITTNESSTELVEETTPDSGHITIASYPILMIAIVLNFLIM